MTSLPIIFGIVTFVLLLAKYFLADIYKATKNRVHFLLLGYTSLLFEICMIACIIFTILTGVLGKLSS